MLDAFPFDNLTSTVVCVERRAGASNMRPPALLNCSNRTVPAQLAFELAHWDQAFSEVRALGLLRANWDGYQALGISNLVVDNALRALKMMSTSNPSIPIPNVTPTSSGTISLIWDTSELDAVLEFGLTRYSGYLQGRHEPIVYLEGSATNFGFDDRDVLTAAISSDLSWGAVSKISTNTFLDSLRLAA